MLADYSTISMSDFVLVIGGLCQQSEDIDSITHAVIAKFRNNKWTQAGNLMVPKKISQIHSDPEDITDP